MAYLEQQLADEETVVTYLRLQADGVRRALAVAENRKPTDPGPHRPPAAPAMLGPASTRAERKTPGFMIEQRRTPSGPLEAAVHIDDCTMTSDRTHRVSAHEARLALTDAQLESCAFCRPDTELGILD